MEESSKSLEMRRLSLIDISAGDDFLLTACDLQNWQSSDPSEICNEHNCFEVVETENTDGEENAMVPVISEPSEPTRARKVGKCNLRKSLAWDNAFFTSEGVLDPDELAIVNKPLKKDIGHALPGIQEDVHKSTESDSTLSSDSWALESLEVDLFEDIRASIQKSGHACAKASDVASSNSKTGQRRPHIPYLVSSQKVELASRNWMKPVRKVVSTSKRQNICKLEGEKKLKEANVCPGAGVTRKADQSLSLKPPKILTSAKSISMVPTKRIVAASDCIKVKNNTAKVCGNVGNQRHTISKKPLSGVSRLVTPGILSSPKSSSGSISSTKMLPEISGTSFNSTGSTSSGSTGKSATKNLRNRTLSQNADQYSADSTVKTPLRNLRNKTELKNSHLSAYVISTSKSSSISPASSFDDMSSESSSSICSASRRPNSSKASFDVISMDSLESVAPQSPDSQKHLHDQPHVGFEDSRKDLLNQGVEKASMETGALSRPTAAAASKSSFVGNAVKPSGLRMPSPKIGFFDAEKSAGLILNGCFQSHSGIQIGQLKNASAIGNLDGAFKQKPYKFQSTRSITQTGNMKFNSNIGSSRYAAASSKKSTTTQRLQQLSTPTAELTGTSGMTEDPKMFVKDSHERSPLGSQRQLGSNEKKILVSEDSLDGLSRSLENVNLNMDTAKDIERVQGSSLVPFGVQSSGNSSDTLSSSISGVLVHDRHVDFLQSPLVSASPTKVELKPIARTPLAVNCRFSNTRISINPMVEPTTERLTDKTSISPFVDKTMQTPAPVAFSGPSVELGQENVAANIVYGNCISGNKKAVNLD